MALLIQGAVVITLNEAIERCIDGGVAAFREFAPNAMGYSDEFLSQCSFMTTSDAEQFLSDLRIRGVQADGENPECVLIALQNPEFKVDVPWMQVFEYRGHMIAMHTQDKSGTMLAPDGFDWEKKPDLTHYSAEEIAERLDFVRREGAIDVYRDKETGQELFVARSTESPDEIFDRAIEILSKHFVDPGRPAVESRHHDSIREAIGELQKIVANYPDFWQAYFYIAKGRQSIGQLDRAVAYLQKAFEVEKSETIICKELAGTLLTLGENQDALEYAQHAVTLNPSDADLLCNLAVNFVLVQDETGARKAIDAALKIAPQDPINQRVAKLVEDISHGRRPWPKTLSDLMRVRSSKRKPGKKPWWRRIFG